MTQKSHSSGYGQKKSRQARHRLVTVEGKTVQEAISKGLAILGAPRNQVSIQVLVEENKGLFGLRGSKPAKIQVSLKADQKA